MAESPGVGTVASCSERNSLFLPRVAEEHSLDVRTVSKLLWPLANDCANKTLQRASSFFGALSLVFPDKKFLIQETPSRYAQRLVF